MRAFVSACVVLLTVGLLPFLGFGAFIIPAFYLIYRMGYAMFVPDDGEDKR